MTDNLPSIPGKVKAIWRIVKAAGPLLIAQSRKLSEEYAQHQLRLAEVDAIRELMIAEARTIAEVRKKLIDKYLDAPAEDRLRLRQDIEMAEKDLRQLGVYQKAMEQVPEGQTFDAQTTAAESLDPPDEFKAWLDTFNEYARKQNESWRVDLLAKALALMSANPGVLNQRALWFIGTVDEKSFHAFAAILDVALKLDSSYVVPNQSSYIERVIPTCALGPNVQLGQALFLLSDLGLIGDLQTTQMTFPLNSLMTVSYGTHSLRAITTREIKIGGVILTSLGDSIAQLYEPKRNNLGLEIYNNLLKAIRESSLKVLSEI